MRAGLGQQILHGLQGRGGQLLRQPGAQFLKGVGLGDKIGFAVYLQEHPGFMVRGDMGPDRAFRGGPIGPFGRHRQALLAQVGNGGLQVARRFLQGLFTIHHPGVGLVTQGFYHFGSYFQFISPCLRLSIIVILRERSERRISKDEILRCAQNDKRKFCKV